MSLGNIHSICRGLNVSNREVDWHAGSRPLHNTGWNTLGPRQRRRHFADDIFRCISINENVLISFKMLLKFVPNVTNDNIPALSQIIAWRRPGKKPLSEPVVASLLTHICVTRPQWVKRYELLKNLKQHKFILPETYRISLLLISADWSLFYCRRFGKLTLPNMEMNCIHFLILLNVVDITVTQTFVTFNANLDHGLGYEERKNIITQQLMTSPDDVVCLQGVVSEGDIRNVSKTHWNDTWGVYIQ